MWGCAGILILTHLLEIHFEGSGKSEDSTAPGRGGQGIPPPLLVSVMSRAHTASVQGEKTPWLHGHRGCRHRRGGQGQTGEQSLDKYSVWLLGSRTFLPLWETLENVHKKMFLERKEALTCTRTTQPRVCVDLKLRPSYSIMTGLGFPTLEI